VKVQIEIDCTAEEARQFFGLPDVRHANEAVMSGIESGLAAAMKGMDPETLLAKWMPTGAPGLEQLQKAFLAAMTGKKD
jgi:hypothetical protein